MTIAEDRVEHEITIDAPVDVVFAYFTDPVRHATWLGSSAELDPRPGGRYRCVVNEHAVVRGEYLEVSPPHRVSFTWGFEDNEPLPPGSSTVSVTLEAVGASTVLRLVHTGLPHPMLGPHDLGWDGYLVALGVAAGPPASAHPYREGESG